MTEQAGGFERGFVWGSLVGTLFSVAVVLLMAYRSL